MMIHPDPCQYFSAFITAGVPEAPLQQALGFLQKHNAFQLARHQLAIADYTQRSDRKRFYLVQLLSGTVESYRVSHGSGTYQGIRYGDRDHDGMLDRCQYLGQKRNMTRSGFFRVAELYTSHRHLAPPAKGHWPHQWPMIDRHHNGRRMDGLTPGVNGEARPSGIVMHGAWYNHAQIMGRSFGCPAFTYDEAPVVIRKLEPGTLFYAYTGQLCPKQMEKVLMEIPNWSSVCTPSVSESTPYSKPR